MTGAPIQASRTIHRTCPLCEATCGLDLTFEGERLLSIRGDADDVFSRGFICPKGAALAELHDDPDRLRQPLVRRGDSWHESSWAEAFERVEAGLQAVLTAHGRQSVAVYLGNPTVHSLGTLVYVKPFAKALGTRNIFSASTVDQMPKHAACGLMFGHPRAIPVPDLDRTDYLLMLGANPWVSNGSLCTAPDFPGRLRAIQRRGGKVVVVDPRRSRTAKRADEHVFVRPATDALLLAAIAHTLLDGERVDLGRLEAHVVGLDRLPALLSPFTPEAVAPVTGVEPSTVRRLARELASAPSAAVYGRIGTCTVAFGTLASWLVEVVNVVTGNLDRPGGAMFPLAAHARHRPDRCEGGGGGFSIGRWHSRVRGLPEVMGELPVTTLADEIETPGQGQVRALVTIAGNPVLSTPNGARLDRALSTLDFMVSLDPYLNETTRRADVILPPPSPLARSHFDLAFYELSVRNIANYSPPAVEVDGGALPEWQILVKLACIALGQGRATPVEVADDWGIGQLVAREVADAGSPIAGRSVDAILEALAPRRGPDRILDFRLRAGPYGDHFGDRPDGLTLAVLEANPHGIDLGPLSPRLPQILQTPSGRIELVPDPIAADIDRLRRCLDTRQNGTLVLVGRRQLRSNNSWMHNVPMLVRGKERCTLHIHPDDAGRLGLSDGATATVRTETGEVSLPVEVTDDIMPGVVSIPHGWGHDLDGARLGVAREHAGVNSNLLAGGEMDPLSGNAVLNGIPVEVRRA